MKLTKQRLVKIIKEEIGKDVHNRDTVLTALRGLNRQIENGSWWKAEHTVKNILSLIVKYKNEAKNPQSLELEGVEADPHLYGKTPHAPIDKKEPVEDWLKKYLASTKKEKAPEETEGTTDNGNTE